MNKTKNKLMALLAVSVLAGALAGCATGRQVKGYVTGVSVANRTITIDNQLISVPRNIRMTKAGTPIALQDVAVGDKVDARVSEGSENPPEANSFTVLGSSANSSGKNPRK